MKKIRVVNKIVTAYFDIVWKLAFIFCYAHPVWIAWNSQFYYKDQMLMVLAVLILEIMSTVIFLIMPIVCTVFISSAMFLGWITALSGDLTSPLLWWSLFNIVLMLLPGVDRRAAFWPIRNLFT